MMGSSTQLFWQELLLNVLWLGKTVSPKAALSGDDEGQ